MDLDGPNPRGCRDVEPWQTTVRGLGSYTIPKVDVLVSATVRSQPAADASAAQLAGAEHGMVRRSCGGVAAARGCNGDRQHRRST